MWWALLLKWLVDLDEILYGGDDEVTSTTCYLIL
jgi:hypothetical protein